MATEIWMWGSPNVANKVPGWEGVRADAGDMWKPDAPWGTVAGAIKVIQIPPGNIERAREGDLQRALADIERRRIALAVGTGLLIRSDRCRAKTEAYVDLPALERMFGKLRRNGADVKYVTMDEPFYYGHKDSSPTACHEFRSSACPSSRPEHRDRQKILSERADRRRRSRHQGAPVGR